MTDIERQPATPRNHIPGARLDLDAPDGGHETGGRDGLQLDFANPDRGTGERIPTQCHGSRPGVARRPGKHHIDTSLPGDAIDDGQGRLRFSSTGPCSMWNSR